MSKADLIAGVIHKHSMPEQVRIVLAAQTVHAKTVEAELVKVASAYIHSLDFVHAAKMFFRSCATINLDKFNGCRWCGWHKDKGHTEDCLYNRFASEIKRHDEKANA